jgi:hypothetical protein
MAPRPLKREETAVIARLLEMVPDEARPQFEQGMLVEEMLDGGMGSLLFIDESGRSRRMGRELVTAEYIDEDQIPVLISINLDEEGDLFELDFWKVNFMPLKRYPRPEGLHAAPPPATIGAKPAIVNAKIGPT